MAPAQASLLAKLDTQERVRDFLTNAVASGRASHAYLFLGAPGAGKLDAAWALARMKKRPAHVFLAHLSEKNNTPELAENTVEEILHRQGLDIPICMTAQDRAVHLH